MNRRENWPSLLFAEPGRHNSRAGGSVHALMQRSLLDFPQDTARERNSALPVLGKSGPKAYFLNDVGFDQFEDSSRCIATFDRLGPQGAVEPV